MTKHYLQAPWPDFSLDGVNYSLAHLAEYHLSAEDSDGNAREILVIFSDHCFTDKDPANQADSERLLYPASARQPGYFCLKRYGHSLSLLQHIEAAKTRSVWNASGQNFAIVPTVTDDGHQAYYAVIFGLRRLKAMPPFDLLMDVVSAYVVDDIKAFATYGVVGFKKLVTVTMQGRRLPTNHSSKRKRPG